MKHKWFKKLDEAVKNKEKEKEFKEIQMNAIKNMAQFVTQNRFKQAVLQYISNQFNLQKEEDDLRDLFKPIDISGTGQITKNEFTRKLEELYGENNGKELAGILFEQIDLDGSGKISYDEFLTTMITTKKFFTEEKIKQAFKLFDKDNSGKLSINEIRGVFGGTEEQWRNVIREVDINNDGEVDFEEFKKMMFNMDKNGVVEKEIVYKEIDKNENSSE